MDNWISVKEKLPETNVIVLIWNKRKGKGRVNIDKLANDGFWINSNRKDVTHWQLLPAPPSTIEQQ